SARHRRNDSIGAQVNGQAKCGEGEGPEDIFLPWAGRRGSGLGCRYAGRDRLVQNAAHFFSKTIRCCWGRSSYVLTCVSPTNFISLIACAWVILWCGLMFTSGSSPRYSRSITRPPGFSAFTIAVIIS